MPVNACCCQCDCLDGEWSFGYSRPQCNGNSPASLPTMPCGDVWTSAIRGLDSYLLIDSTVQTAWADLTYIQVHLGSDGCDHYVDTWLRSLSPYNNPPYTNYYDELFATGNTVERFIAWIYFCDPAYLQTYGAATDCDYRGPVFGCAWQLCVRTPDDELLGVGGYTGCAQMPMRMHKPVKQANGQCKWTVDFVCNTAGGTGGWWFITEGTALTNSCCPQDGDTATFSLPVWIVDGTLTGTMTFAEAGF